MKLKQNRLEKFDIQIHDNYVYTQQHDSVKIIDTITFEISAPRISELSRVFGDQNLNVSNAYGNVLSQLSAQRISAPRRLTT